jgi:hypothetical protein
MWGRKLIAVVLISFFYFLAMIPIIFDVRQYFVLELAIYAVLLLFTIIAVLAIYFEQRWAWSLLTLLFAFGLANLLWTYFLTLRPFLFAISIVLAVIGFVYSVLNISASEEYEYEKYREKVKKGVSDDEVIVEEIKPLTKPEEEPTEKRYVGSTKAAEYHLPDCIAAKRIHKKNAVWFSGVKDAEGQGYSAHTCVK